MAPVPRHATLPALSAATTAAAEAWLAGIRRGEEHAFVQLVRAYFPGLCDVCAAYAADDPAAIEEIVHDVLLSLWRRRTDLTIEGNLFAYLAGAVRKRALTYQYKRQRERHTREAAAREADLGMGTSAQPQLATDSALERHEQWTRIRTAVDQLPPKRRLVLMLRWTRQLSFAEIATALGVSIRTAETQHLRAMQDLRRLLGRTDS